MPRVCNGSATSSSSEEHNFNQILTQFIVNVHANGNSSTQRDLCEELLFTLHNHHAAAHRLDLRHLSRHKALDKLTKRLIELILEKQTKLLIIISDEHNNINNRSTTDSAASRLRRELLTFIRNELKNCTQIFNDGAMDGQILVHLYNTPQILASLSRQNVQLQQQQHHLLPPTTTTTNAQNGHADHHNGNIDESEINPDQLIDWSINKTTGDWEIRVKLEESQCSASNIILLIEIIRPFVVGALGGYCNQVIIHVNNDDRMLTQTKIGTQLLDWLDTIELCYEPDSPGRGRVTIKNLGDSLRRVKAESKIVRSPNDTQQQQPHNSCLEQLLHILNVEGHDFDPADEIGRRARSVQNLNCANERLHHTPSHPHMCRSLSMDFCPASDTTIIEQCKHTEPQSVSVTTHMISQHVQTETRTPMTTGPRPPPDSHDSFVQFLLMISALAVLIAIVVYGTRRAIEKVL